jgi:hypothetical protein
MLNSQSVVFVIGFTRAFCLHQAQDDAQYPNAGAFVASASRPISLTPHSGHGLFFEERD